MPLEERIDLTVTHAVTPVKGRSATFQYAGSRRQIAGSRSELQTLDNDNRDVVRRRTALGVGLDVALDEFFELHDG